MRLVLEEHHLDRGTEETSHAQGEWEGRVEAAGLDVVDRLPGHAEGIGELGLGQATFASEGANMVTDEVSN